MRAVFCAVGLAAIASAACGQNVSPLPFVQNPPAEPEEVADAGSQAPHLKVTPDPVLDFTEQTAEVSVLPLEICNVPAAESPTVPAGDLVIDALRFLPHPLQQAPNPFAILTVPASGTVVRSGECITLDVQFTRPFLGGPQYGTLGIETNDPDWGPPAYKKITLYSWATPAPVEFIPVADCRGPNGAQYFSVEAATLNPKRIKICGNDSYVHPFTLEDPVPRGIERWKYTLARTPIGAVKATITALHTSGGGPNVSGLALRDADCDGVSGDGCCVELNIDPVALGSYRIHCVVYDAEGKQSGNTAEVNIIAR